MLSQTEGNAPGLLHDRGTIHLHGDVEILRGGLEGFWLLNGRTGECFTMGLNERYLLYLLERVEPVEKILAAFELRFGRQTSEKQLREFVGQLRQRGLLKEIAEPPDKSSKPIAKQTPPPPTDPLSLASPGAKLNLAFDFVVLVFGWVFTPLIIVPILLLVLAAVNVGVRHGDRMASDFRTFVDSFSMSFYLVLIVVPKVFLLSGMQSILAGMACRSFGGRLQSIRIHLRGGLIPVLRIQCDNSPQLLSRRRLLTVVSTNFWFALVMGAICFVGWAIATPGSSARTAFVILIPPCLIRLVIQCNVFFRLSSAHMLLCEMVGERRLLDLARAEITGWLKFGRSPNGFSDIKRFWLRLFGLGYVVYRIAVVCLLTAGAFWLVYVYGQDGDLPIWSVEYVLIAMTLILSWNRDRAKDTPGVLTLT